MNTKKEIWDTYLETFDHGKTGSKTYRVDLIKKAPFQTYPHLLIAGTKYKTSNDDGFPENGDFPILFNLGDELYDLIEAETQVIMVGSFLYNEERLEYFYVQNPNKLVSKIEEFYRKNYSDRKFFITIKEDKEWMYYKEFLYPKPEQKILSDIFTEV